MDPGWQPGNRYRLLENGEAYFPAVFNAIAAARREVLVETFILFDDQVGRELQQALIAAAGRGVSVDLLVDGYGSDELTDEFISTLTNSGVRFHVFDPRPRLLGVRTNVFRRMHRKIVAVDEQIAFVGGINFSADHLPDYGPDAKQDYALSVNGPLAAVIAEYARAALSRGGKRIRHRMRWNAMPKEDGGGRLVVRDNYGHTTDIERYYR
ncbi:MAG: cardiolipin synthase ClsB, partial [Achromobacter pestifer]